MVICLPTTERYLGELPTGATLIKESALPVELIQVFVSSKKQLEELFPKVKNLVAKNGLLLVTYPKGKAEINRDSIREYASTIGFQTVSLMAVDETWSALRLKIV